MLKLSSHGGFVVWLSFLPLITKDLKAFDQINSPIFEIFTPNYEVLILLCDGTQAMGSSIQTTKFVNIIYSLLIPSIMFAQTKISQKKTTTFTTSMKRAPQEYLGCFGCLKPSHFITNPLTQISDIFISFLFEKLLTQAFVRFLAFPLDK